MTRNEETIQLYNIKVGRVWLCMHGVLSLQSFKLKEVTSKCKAFHFNGAIATVKQLWKSLSTDWILFL